MKYFFRFLKKLLLDRSSWGIFEKFVESKKLSRRMPPKEVRSFQTNSVRPAVPAIALATEEGFQRFNATNQSRTWWFYSSTRKLVVRSKKPFDKLRANGIF